MADQDTWANRVSEWKSSGLTSIAYCEGKPFTAGGLRHWGHRLGLSRQRARPAVRVVRLVRVSEVQASSQNERSAAGGGAAVVVEIAAARIAVRPGFDRATLTAVVEVLAATTRTAP